MPLEIIPSVRPDAQQTELVGALQGLAEVLDRLLNAGLDHANFRRGSLSLGTGSGVAGNLNARFLSVTTNAAADTESAFAHGLGRVPVGYIVVRNGNGGVVYGGVTAWTAENIYLRCTTASNQVLLIVF